MDTQTRYPRRVARQKWTPPTPAVQERIDAVVRLYQEQKEAERRYKEALADLTDTTREDFVPIAHIAERLEVERKTVYRHLGRSMT